MLSRASKATSSQSSVLSRGRSAFGSTQIEALGMRVDVHAAVAVVESAGEADQGLTELLSGLDSQRGGGGDTGQQGDPGHIGLLGDLEAGAGGDQQDMVAQGQQVLHQRPDRKSTRLNSSHVAIS